MLPLLSKFDVARRAGHCDVNAPPARFKPLRGPATNVRLRLGNTYERAEGMTSAQKAGLRYEAKVQEYLLDRFSNYHAAPYVHFEDGGVMRTIQPDGLLLREDCCFIFEVKHQHMPEAWWQLEKLYRPVLEAFDNTTPWCCVEVCRSYDPAQPFPCPVQLVEDLKIWTAQPRHSFGVFVWRR